MKTCLMLRPFVNSPNRILVKNNVNSFFRSEFPNLPLILMLCPLDFFLPPNAPAMIQPRFTRVAPSTRSLYQLSYRDSTEVVAIKGAANYSLLIIPPLFSLSGTFVARQRLLEHMELCTTDKLDHLINGNCAP